MWIIWHVQYLLLPKREPPCVVKSTVVAKVVVAYPENSRCWKLVIYVDLRIFFGSFGHSFSKELEKSWTWLLAVENTSPAKCQCHPNEVAFLFQNVNCLPVQKGQPALKPCGRSFLQHPCSEEDHRAVDIETSNFQQRAFPCPRFFAFSFWLSIKT